MIARKPYAAFNNPVDEHKAALIGFKFLLIGVYGGLLSRGKGGGGGGERLPVRAPRRGKQTLRRGRGGAQLRAPQTGVEAKARPLRSFRVPQERP